VTNSNVATPNPVSWVSMSEVHFMSDPTSLSTDAPTPGQLIREARERLGLHIVALAAALKVPVRKLEALEANRWEELTDATFTRALASSVARHLKIDAGPLLARLPTARPATLNSPVGLGQVEAGVSSSAAVFAPAAFLAGRQGWVGLLLVAAAGLYFYPEADVAVSDERPLLAEVAPGGSFAGSATEPAVGAALVADVPASSFLAATATPGAAVAPVVDVRSKTETGILALTASVDAWVEVTDHAKRVRIQRVLKQGEEAVFAEGAPFAVVVGNASGAKVTVRGESFDLASVAKNNVARFEVK
jgi:cytoskeleton protein RodZ